MAFSSVLKIADVDDFINPSQECIKPITSKLDKHEKYNHRSQSEKVKISLNDCLACSGCITSAESVLISKQSKEEFYAILDKNQRLQETHQESRMKTIIVSISPQSRAALAVNYNLDINQIGKMLAATFKKVLGASYVFDATFARDFSLIESQREFIDRYCSSSPCKLPVFASACPGWICYAEKIHGKFILPYLSAVKSPQQIMGSLIKDYFANQIGKRPSDIYHVTVMPCYDKKLEASRNDFYNESLNAADVDCVLTSGEVMEIFNERGCVVVNGTSENLDRPFVSVDENNEVLTHDGGGSGGYLENVFKTAAAEIFQLKIQNMIYKTVRNKDFREVILTIDGKSVLKGAIVYGFRNIQNIVQRMKRGKCLYDYVEIMACPGGCLNGGGQPKIDLDSNLRLHLMKLEKCYNSAGEWLDGSDSYKARKMLYTTYYDKSQSQNAISVKW
ncbi:uncharacterized protein TRIADDRAFT_61804 [Trichoplax adhaerens]|uniref:Iron hydrogenase large subunit C-terminal domain-containing protein n=1 Tax=Trichoplax adhaerens TaxID=10228 RepID=B3SC06_TRIAD|nr:hypothetical protein TRIADDRAFT_61804 [Trichoplax adhaerens]EDV19766.1 hypothetical protein TRIADDRAFT_61804 [Trichoplax adhaerens]|eukprot:XP_002117790.1 hypothetical protein TRIADDRAFT_61804 [Trichoplax adhaerens]